MRTVYYHAYADTAEKLKIGYKTRMQYCTTGTYDEISSSDHRIVWSGRKVVESGDSKTPSGVRFDWPGVTLSVLIDDPSVLYIYMNGGGNSFNVRWYSYNIFKGGIEDALYEEIISTDYTTRSYSLRPRIRICKEIIQSDGRVCYEPDGQYMYLLQVSKRNEPRFKGIFSYFLPCTIHRLKSDGLFQNLSFKQIYPGGTIEIIGDSDACAFGANGSLSSPSSVWTIDYRHENADISFSSIIAKSMNAAVSTIAWSGKGIYRNAPFAGHETIVDLYPRLISIHSDPLCPVSHDVSLVIIHAGANDLINPFNQPSCDPFSGAYQSLLSNIRLLRGPTVPILCLVNSPRCCSSEGSPTKHPKDCLIAQKHHSILLSYTSTAIEAFTKQHHDKNVHLLHVDCELDLQHDYGSLMHWSVSGHRKIADCILDLADTKLIDVPAKKNQKQLNREMPTVASKTPVNTFSYKDNK